MGKTPTDSRAATKAIPDLAADDSVIDGTKTQTRVATKAPPSIVRDRPFIVILEGGSVGEMHLLQERETMIGRALNVSIRLDDAGVSRRHAKLTLEGHDVFIEDLGSSNGTQVNGETVAKPRLLRDGDKISIGPTLILKFAYGDEVDVTFQRRMLDAALKDGLTGAFNKRYLLDRLSTELAFAHRQKTPVSVIMMDLDHFKRINDTFGHPAGDEVLVKLASVVHETIRKEDVFARYGGEEFAVICRSVDVKHAGILAERIRERVAAMIVAHEGERIPVTVSLGVSGFPELPADTPEKLVANADEALYEAKRQGRNRVILAHRAD